MKDITHNKSILTVITKNFTILFILNIINLIICDVSISKLNKDVLKDFENLKIALFLNETHFSCDKGQNILDMNKFNDDFCDCKDGSDENSNNPIMF